MKKFIVSDLHGNGNIYNSIMYYLENLKDSLDEDITLYINGDLIDRGIDSASMLLDVMKRVNNHSKIKIEYLAGNHELLMYKALNKIIRTGRRPLISDWFLNGGIVTLDGLEQLVDKEDLPIINEFISNLKIYHKFQEKLDRKRIVLVHSKCPKVVDDECNLRIKDDNMLVDSCIWTRKEDAIFRVVIGNKDYFTIIGHTPLHNKYGYKYYEDENYLNIDGGCAAHVLGYKGYDHTPLVEICDNSLRILTFNSNNEIIYGNYFEYGASIPMEEEELDNYRFFLNKEYEPHKLVLDR